MGFFRKKVESESDFEESDVHPEKYDGFYFVPDYDDYYANLKLAFFSFKDEMKDAERLLDDVDEMDF